MNLSLPDFSILWPHLLAAAPTALVVAIAAFAVNFLISRGLGVVARRTDFSENELKPVRRALKWVILLVTAILLLGTLGVNVGGVWGMVSTLFAMVAIGFVAVWSVLSNSLCTVMIMVFRPFAVGDEIEFPGETVRGRVIDLNFMYTTLDAGDGSVLKVPNNLFFQKTLRRRRPTDAVPTGHPREKSARDAIPGPSARAS